MSEQEDPRTVALQLIASMALCDNMSDVADDVSLALKKLGVSIDWFDLSELGRKLGEMGITTLYGANLSDDE